MMLRDLRNSIVCAFLCGSNATFAVLNMLRGEPLLCLLNVVAALAVSTVFIRYYRRIKLCTQIADDIKNHFEKEKTDHDYRSPLADR